MFIKKLKSNMYFAVILIIFIFFLFLSDKVAAATRQQLFYCIETVLPSLFVFFVLTSVIIKGAFSPIFTAPSKKQKSSALNLPGEAGFCVLLGLVSGFPMGAKIADDLYGEEKINMSEAHRIAAFCNNASPAFIISFVGAEIFKNINIGVILYFATVLSCLICLMITGERRKKDISRPTITPKKTEPFYNVLTSSVIGSVLCAVKVCGFIVFFGTLCTVLIDFSYPVNAIISGGIELTNGVMLLKRDMPGFILCAAMLGFSGICVMFQSASVCSNLKFNFKKYIFYKMLQALVMCSMSLTLYLLLEKLL